VSYVTAKAQLVSIAEGTTLSAPGMLGLGDKLVRRKDQGPRSTARVGRSFHFWSAAGTHHGYYNRRDALQPEAMHEVEFVVFYPEAADVDLLDTIMESDRLDVSKRFLDPSLWDPSTSRIINTAHPGDALLPYRRNVVAGGYELAIVLLLHHR
jgi:hypothetical protein